MKIKRLIPALAFAFLLFASVSGQSEKATKSFSLSHTKASTDSLFEKASALKTALKFDSAALLFQKTSLAYESLQNWEKYITSQRQLAYCLWITHRGGEALELSQRMIEEGTELLGPEHIQIAKLYTVMGNVHADRRTRTDFDQCVAYYEKALEITRKVYDEGHPVLAEAYERLGIARYLIDDYAGAIPFYEKALSTLEAPAPETASAYAKIHNNLGLIYSGMGYLSKALENFKQAKFFIREMLEGQGSRVVKVSKNIAQIQMQMGDFEEALVTLEEAWALDAKVGEKGSKIKAYLLGSIGDCYLVKEDLQEAVSYFERCLAYWEEDKRDDANALILEYSRIGQCYIKLNQAERAYDNLQKGYAILSKYYDPDNLNWADPLINLGLASLAMGNTRLAENYLQRALSNARRKVGKNHRLIGRIHIELARLFLQENYLEKALEQALKAEAAVMIEAGDSEDFPAIEQISNLQDYIIIQELIGLVKTRRYERSANIADLLQARRAFHQGMAYSDSLKTNLQSGPSLQKAQRQLYSLAEKAIDCLYLLWQTTREEKYLHEAFIFFEKSKSDWLRSSAREWKAREYAGVPEELVERELNLKTQLTYYQSLKRNRRIAPVSEDDFKAAVWQERYFQANKELNSLLKDLEKNYPDYYQLKYDFTIASLPEMQKFAELKDAELITYFWGEKSAYVMRITPDDSQLIKIASPACIESWLDLLHQSMDKSKPIWQADDRKFADFQAFCNSARALYVYLLEPVLQEESPRPLILVPDGPLGRLPFQILLSANAGRQTVGRLDYRVLPYLIRSRPIYYAYSTSLLGRQNIRERGKGYAGFSPSFDENPTLTSLSRGDGIPLERRYPSELRRDDWGRLVYNRQEIEETAALIGGKKFTGGAATEHNFREAATEARILHLATHAFTHDTEPDYSTLIFARDAKRPKDGRLHAYELYNLPLRAELAVLSACNTGAGSLRRGEGVMSLSRSFKYAGCPSVLMSLWPANDAATKEIVVHFFRRLKQNATKSEAIRQASLDFLSNVKNDDLTHPFYWANFVSIGKDDPIHLEKKAISFQLWIVLLAGLFGLFGLIALKKLNLGRPKLSG